MLVDKLAIVWLRLFNLTLPFKKYLVITRLPKLLIKRKMAVVIANCQITFIKLFK